MIPRCRFCNKATKDLTNGRCPSCFPKNSAERHRPSAFNGPSEPTGPRCDKCRRNVDAVTVTDHRTVCPDCTGPGSLIKIPAK